MIDLSFPVTAQSPIRPDHGYDLYAALSRRIPAIHDPVSVVAVHPINGRIEPGRQLHLTDASHLTIRCEAGLIGELVQLTGCTLALVSVPVRLGTPQVKPLRPATALYSRLVTIKVEKPVTVEKFYEFARRQLQQLAISDQADLHIGKQRTLAIKGRNVLGFEVGVTELLAEESLRLQEHGLGGRKKMGAGIFVPMRDNTKRNNQTATANTN